MLLNASREDGLSYWSKHENLYFLDRFLHSADFELILEDLGTFVTQFS